MHALVAIWMSMLAALGLIAYGSHTSAPPPETPLFPIEEEAEHRESPEKDGPRNVGFPVVKVVDGDTIVIRKDAANITLRLIGMDAPETTTLRKGVVECFGKEATEEARRLLDGASITLATDDTQDQYDKYGRTLAYVFLPDGRNFAEVMIRGGYAHEYTYKLPYTHQSVFKAAQRDAEKNERGLWSADACSDIKESRAPRESAGAAAALGTYECTKNTYNCSSFKTQAEAQVAFDFCGGSSRDVHKLDSDGDGSVCEGLR